VAPTKSPSHERSRLWRHILHHVSATWKSCVLAHATSLTPGSSGLQTPRLKRLAEIVSAQAIAQQEKFESDEYETNGEDLADVDEVDVDGA
jgi:hypothetical protein